MMPFDEGCQVERKLFEECLLSPQAKALMHVFFAEREVAKIPDVPKDTPVIPVKTAGVVGAGGGFEITLKKQITVRLDARNWTLFNENHSSNGQEYSGGLAIFF